MNFTTRLLAAVVLLGPWSGSATAQVCHLVVVADTDDDRIGNSVELDANNIFSLFTANVAAPELSITRVDGSRLSKATVLSTIRTMRLQGRDTLVVYYAGHGGFVRDMGQFLATPGERLFRTELLAVMQSRDTSLAVLVTDTCSNYVKAKIALAREPAKPPRVTAPAFRTLYFEAKGLVDLSATTPGEIAMGNDVLGGYFTSSLCDWLATNSARNVGWDVLSRGVTTATATRFKEENPRGVPFGGGRQLTQTVYARITAPGAEGRGPRFGVRVVDQPGGGGAIVAEVVADSPASRVLVPALQRRVSLEKGDEIVEINGTPIRGAASFANAVDASGKTMKLRVRNVRDGKLYTMVVDLRD